MVSSVSRFVPMRPILIVAMLVLVAACAQRQPAEAINDPHEEVNRAWFERNLAVDRAFSPLTRRDGNVSPEGAALVRVLRNFGTNLSAPKAVIHYALQFRPDRAVEHAVRFAINSTLGIGGLFDVAGAMGIHARSTDFGETLHVWGVGEGNYVVLPLIGPSTERDAIGRVLDLAINPWHGVLNPTEARVVRAMRLAGRVAERIDYADIIDANVMQSADPYAQARLLFLQARRYHLGVEIEEEFIDPYADF